MERREYERIVKLVIDGNYDRAVVDAESLLANGDNDAYELLSDVNVAMYEMSGDKRYLSRAKENLDNAEANGINTSAKRFSILLGMGDFVSAGRVVENEKDMMVKMFLEAMLMLEKQDTESAKKKLEKLISYTPNRSEPYIIYSKILYSEGEYEKAIEALKKGTDSITDELHKTEAGEEYLRITSLYTTQERELLVGTFSLENAKWVLTKSDSIVAKTPDEFLNMIGIGMNENQHIIMVMPKNDSLFELVKDDFLGLLPEGVDYKDFEFMVSQMKSSME
jgi:tetratricopeptide (TPR) repeat protein